jgi:tetratricopeptide (TPR) repeat protein
LKTLADQIVGASLKTQIIFTARPMLRMESANLISIGLRGLKLDAARELFENKSQSPISDTDMETVFSVTEGHPLWISLMASRCRHERITPKIVAAEIIAGKGTLPERTILSMWNRLNDKQKIVLRTLAELERPLPLGEIAKIDFELNYNQIAKSLKVLKSFALVDSKVVDANNEFIDLHPLIRQYVRSNFPRAERKRFISKIILVLDRRLSALRAIFKNSVPISVLEVWTHRVDLNINNDDIPSAIDATFEMHDPLLDSGMIEEYIRLTARIFEIADWMTIFSSSHKANVLWLQAVNAFAYMGRWEDADLYIQRYQDSIEGVGAKFINLCNARCYRYWLAGDFDQAIFHGELGVNMKVNSSVDTPYDASHNLALARRESGQIDDALEYFLGGALEKDVLEARELDAHKKGSFYGNIGRCYYLKAQIDNALICYRKSAELLEKSQYDALNRGYIRQWVGEALIKKGQLEDGAMFLRAGHLVWNGFIPSRAASLAAELEELLESNQDLRRVAELPAWRLENRFTQWLKS